MSAPPRPLDPLLDAEHDTVPPRTGMRPERSYLVCSTPRTGSGLLCRGLASTGAAGVPLEYFNHVKRIPLTERWGCAGELEPYVEALHANRTDGAGLFGAKAHWAQLAEVRAEAHAGSADQSLHETAPELIELLFPNATFVRTVRMDLDRQAVSYWRAMASNLWWTEGDEDDVGATPYDFARIDHCRRLIERGEACWERLLRSLGAEPVVVSYEQLAADYEGTVAGVAAALAPGRPVEVAPPSTRKQGDERSEELLERYRRERAELGIKG